MRAVAHGAVDGGQYGVGHDPAELLDVEQTIGAIHPHRCDAPLSIARQSFEALAFAPDRLEQLISGSAAVFGLLPLALYHQ
jgi:hypothetical protein